MTLYRADFLRSIGRPDVARRIETPENRAPITMEQKVAAVELEVELAVNADARRVWKAVARTLRNTVRAKRNAAKR